MEWFATINKVQHLGRSVKIVSFFFFFCEGYAVFIGSKNNSLRCHYFCFSFGGALKYVGAFE